MRSRALRWLIAAVILAAALPVHASWLDALVRAGSKGARSAATHGAGAIEAVAAHVKALPHRADRPALAASGSHEGHWRFVNRSGEAMTAANADEIARALNVLTPEAAQSGRLALYLTEDTVYAHRAMLKDLPGSADLHVVAGGEAYRLLRQGEAAVPRLYAEVRPSLVVEMAEKRLFDEALWQLARPLNRANVRVIALEPGGPKALSSAPRIDRETRRAMTDAIDPDRLKHSFSAIRGQTALVTGRVEGALLHFRPASGGERTLLVRDLTAAAEAADVNLVILRSSSPRQPGARNWLWQQVEVANLDQAMARATISDFLDALAGPAGRMTVTASPAGALRTTLDLAPARGLAGVPSPNPVASALSDTLAEVTGKVVLHGVTATVRSKDRETELEARLVPGIPSMIQHVYIGGLVLGLFGLATARGWWRRIWPPEAAGDYGSRFGFRAAQSVRGLAFTLVFLPLAGLPAFAWQTVRGMAAAIAAPFRWLARRAGAA